MESLEPHYSGQTNQMIKTNSKLRCVLSETQFYEVGALYDVYNVKHEHGEKNARRFVQGSDGIYDDVAMTVSKFKEEKNGKRNKGACDK